MNENNFVKDFVEISQKLSTVGRKQQICILLDGTTTIITCCIAVFVLRGRGMFRCVCVCTRVCESPSLCCVGGRLPNQGSLHEVSARVSRERPGDQALD